MNRSTGLRASLLAVAIVSAVATASAVGLPAAAQSPSPGASASSPPTILWDTGSVRLTADALRISAGGLEFTGQVPAVDLDSDDSSATYRTLEATWQEQGREQRLFLYLAADQGSWWITEVRTRDGAVNADWVTYPAPVFRLPLGATWSGHLRLTAPGATLAIEGMTLRAFAPDTIPAELRFCHPAEGSGTLARTGIETLAPAGAKALLVGMGLCHSFRYEYDVAGGSGYSEVWCDAPPGVIRDVIVGDDGVVIVFVADAVPQERPAREQPPVGWGC